MERHVFMFSFDLEWLCILIYKDVLIFSFCTVIFDICLKEQEIFSLSVNVGYINRITLNSCGVLCLKFYFYHLCCLRLSLTLTTWPGTRSLETSLTDLCFLSNNRWIWNLILMLSYNCSCSVSFLDCVHIIQFYFDLCSYLLQGNPFTKGCFHRALQNLIGATAHTYIVAIIWITVRGGDITYVKNQHLN